MAGSVLVALAAGIVVVAFGVFSWQQARQVRRLRAEIATLAAGRQHVTAPPSQADVASEPASLLAESATAHDDVLTPMPLGLADPEPDLGVGRVASVTLAGPLVKVAAFSHGVRRALLEESRMRIAYAFRKELRRQHKLRRRRAAAGPPRDAGWRP